MSDNPSRGMEWTCVAGDGELSISELTALMADIFGRRIPVEDGECNRVVERINEIGEHYYYSHEDIRHAMDNEIENYVDIRAKLEQLAEECGELIQASMKLIRAIGNGNPTVIGRYEATVKLIEEWSDVTVAMNYILPYLQEKVNFDIREQIEKIGRFKEQRWIERIRKEKENEGYHFDDPHCCDSCDL